MIVLFIPGESSTSTSSSSTYHNTLFIIIINYLLTCLCVFYFVH